MFVFNPAVNIDSSAQPGCGQPRPFRDYRYGSRSTSAPEILSLRYSRKSEACRARLANLSGTDLGRLSAYAHHRLSRIGLPWMSGEDLAHDAIEAVLIGSGSSRSGRHPRPIDTHDQEAFLNYLQGVIRSLAEGEGRNRWRSAIATRIDSEEAEYCLPPCLVHHRTPEALAGCSLFVKEFFARLKDAVPGRLAPMVRLWEREAAWADRIPLGGRARKYRQELRGIARRVLRDLDAGTQNNNGFR